MYQHITVKSFDKVCKRFIVIEINSSETAPQPQLLVMKYLE